MEREGEREKGGERTDKLYRRACKCMSQVSGWEEVGRVKKSLQRRRQKKTMSKLLQIRQVERPSKVRE